MADLRIALDLLKGNSRANAEAIIADLERIRAAAQTAGAAMDAVAAGRGRRGGGGGAAGGGRAGGGDPAADAEREAARIAAIQDKYILRDYNARVSYEARKQTLGVSAAESMERDRTRQAERISELESRYSAQDYQRRVRAEAQKEKLVGREAAQKEIEQQRLSAIEAKYLVQEYQGRVRNQAQKDKLADREAAKAEADRQKLADIESRYIAQDYQNRVRAEAQKIRQQEQREAAETRSMSRILSEDEIMERARTRVTQQQNRARLQAAIERITGESQGLKALASGWDRVVGIAAGMVGLNAIFNAITESLDKQQQSLMESVRFMTDYRDTVRELATLKGMMGDTTAATAADIKLRQVTLMTQDESRRFQEALLGAAEVNVDVMDQATGKLIQQRLIAPAELEKLAGQGGFLANVNKIDPTVAGQLLGNLPLVTGRRMTAEQGTQQFQQMMNIFRLGGGTYTQLGQQFLGNMGFIASGLYKPMEMAALTSGFSLTSKEKAGTLVEQLTRATAGAVGRMRGVQMEGDAEKRGEYLERLAGGGAQIRQMSALQIANLIAADVNKQKAMAAARGEQFNEALYFGERGYGSMEDIKALMLYSGLVEKGQMQPLMAAAGAAPMAPAAIQAQMAKARLDPAFQARRGAVALDIAKVTQAAGPQEFFVNQMRQQFAKLRQTGEVTGEFDEMMQSGAFNIFQGWQYRKVLGGLQEQANEQAAAVGMAPVNLFRARAQGVGAGPGQAGFGGEAQAFFDFAMQMAQRGANIEQPMDTMMQAADKMLQAADAMVRAQAGNLPGGAPPPAQPPQALPPRPPVPGGAARP